MPKASSIVTGPSRRIEDALAALGKFGVVDESTVVVEELDEVVISGKTYAYPATKVTAEVSAA